MNKQWSLVPSGLGSYINLVYIGLCVILSQFFNPYVVVWTTVAVLANAAFFNTVPGTTAQEMTHAVGTYLTAAAVNCVTGLTLLMIQVSPEEFGLTTRQMQVDPIGAVVLIATGISLLWGLMDFCFYVLTRCKRQRLMRPAVVDNAR